ncbi:MAG: tRNA (adenosine(37)-N6)-dimethylallyltransferase MiaA, partial [Allosphingosinicella sp.]
LALAAQEGGTVINADSAQVYRDLRLVTARPSEDDERRIPHYLYGYRDGADICSAADWAHDARVAVEKAVEGGRLPILTGGTGLYLRTLLEGIAPVPDIDPEVRRQVRSLAVDEAAAALASEDPAAAERLRPTDSSRIARALEVVRSSGRPIAYWQQAKVGGIKDEYELRPLILLPPREWLQARCDERFEKIFSDEGIKEVASLLDRGLPDIAPVMRAIGVPEIAGFLAGTLSRDEAIAAGKTATRQYAKRQYTWFRRQPPLDWPRFTDAVDCDTVPLALAGLG